MKQREFPDVKSAIYVALFTRAWIETQPEMEALDTVPVALFTRAWIETTQKGSKWTIRHRSPSSRGRGLKQTDLYRSAYHFCVALFTRAWIETALAVKDSITADSRPLHEGVD